MTRRVPVDPELPWGCWLRIEPGDGTPAEFVDDATGERWGTIREAFWYGRMGMPRGADVPQAKLEFLHGVLAQWARRRPESAERTTDMFTGCGQFSSWYMAWLTREGLIAGRDGLTAEGWAVLHMLMGTRPQDVRNDRPGRATVAQLVELGLGPEEREARLARVEQAALKWGVGFRRTKIGAWPHVILVKRGEGEVPVLETSWSLRFENEEQRDAFYEWLCVRLDRWPAWAEMAGRSRHPELTQHLLMVLAISATHTAEDPPAIGLI